MPTYVITSGTPGFSYLPTALLGKDDPWLREEIENVKIFSFLHTATMYAMYKHVPKIFYLDEIKCPKCVYILLYISNRYDYILFPVYVSSYVLNLLNEHKYPVTKFESKHELVRSRSIFFK